MSLADQIADDVSKVFLNTNDFGGAITYTPQSGVAKTIGAIITEGQESEFYNGTEVHDYDVTEILISCVDNTEGHQAPLVTGRDGAGDKVTMPDTAVDYWVKKILEDGRDSGTGIHRLLIASLQSPLRS